MKIKTNKIIVTVLLSNLCLSSASFASESKNPLYYNNTFNGYIANQPAIPEYKIERLETTNIYFDSKELEELNLSPNITNGSSTNAFDVYDVRNVSSDGKDYIFRSEYIVSDWIDGPSNYSQTYTFSVQAKSSANVSISKYIISVGVGFDVSKSVTHSKNISIDIPSGKKANIRAYGIYKKYDYSIYKNNIYYGKGVAYQPVGLKLEHALYAK